MGYGGMMGWGAGPGWGVLGVLPMLLWALLIGVAIVFAVRWLASGRRTTAGGGDDALRILRERFARGELGKEEFDERKRNLG